MPSHQWVVIKAVVEKRRAIRFRLTASRALHLRFVFMVNPPFLPLLLREEVKGVCFIWDGRGFKASHDSESSFPGTKTLSFFQSVVVAVKETLQPDSHSSLHLKSCLCTLKEQLQARECGCPLVVGVLRRADGIREGLSHKEHQEQVNICSGTTHDPEGLRSLLRWETPAGSGTLSSAPVG